MAVSIEALRRLLAVDADDPVVRYSLGNKLFREGTTDADMREAVEHLRFVVERDPRHVAGFYALGQAQAALGDIDGARETIAAGIAVAEKLAHGEGHDLLPALRDELESLADQ